ncbi:hypothetical protein FDP41_001349 [Naegleria fowleri]|uniref:Complex 1 LYR protein domain-containing protein n=1 Tax=Naegleria fowleri TaxID=5763 RepID=A0A6A5BYR4_NAEFO|nr:uncharacterized protein FDP41_001349 [Naegleria fowleri]KAF0979681.1 hypothetical protein FDP41_001349 [Naegleria fowleri]CAG4711171.1 unnamed protein product [Naegleria fowleri]
MSSLRSASNVVLNTTSTPTRNQILALYRGLLKGGKAFSDYNYREYVLRCTREDFRKFKSVQDSEKIKRLYEKGVKNLGVVQRQSLINQMYSKHVSIMDERAKEYRQNPDLFTQQYSSAPFDTSVEQEED